MNKTDFTALLEQPHLAYQESYEHLEQMLVEYPYCQNVRLLLLKKYKADESRRFEDHLRLAAANAPDRVALYKFLNGTPAKVVPFESGEWREESGEQEIENGELRMENGEKEIENGELKIENDESEKGLLDREAELLGAPVEATTHIEEILDTVENRDEEEENEEGEDGNGHGHDDDHENGRKDEGVLTEMPEKLSSPSDEILNSQFSILNSPPSSMRVPEAVVQEPEPAKSDFADWLLHFQPPRLGEAMPIAPLKKIGTTDKIAARVAKWENPLSGIPEPEKTYAANRDKIGKLLDDSSLPREEADYTVVQELADKSIVDNDEVISETLARLLALQGKKEKAIHMYEKLGLLFPEKCRFFADQIEKIRTT